MLISIPCLSEIAKKNSYKPRMYSKQRISTRTWCRCYIVLLLMISVMTAVKSYAQTTISIIDFCNGSTRSLESSLNEQSGVIYTWSLGTLTNVSGATASATAQTGIVQTLKLSSSLTSNGTAVYNVTVSNGNRYKITVTILPTPYINNRPTAAQSTTCGTVNISGLAASISTPASGWVWSRPAVLGSQSQNGNTNGILDNLIDTTSNQVSVKYAFAITATNGCIGTDTLTYTFLPTPYITSVVKNDTVCSGASYILNPRISPASNNAGGAGTYFTWTNPTPTTGLSGYSVNPTSTTTNFAQTVTNTTSAIVTTTYSLVPSYRYAASNLTCAGPSYQVILSINPRPYLPTPVTISACSGKVFSYAPADGASAGTPAKTTLLPTSTQFTWAAPVYSDANLVTGGSGTIGTAPPAATDPYVDAPISQILTNKSTATQNAKYSIYATAAYGTVSCAALAPFDLIVNINPVPAAKPSQDTIAVCSGSAPTLAPITGITSYSWTTPQITPANTLGGSTGSGSGAVFAPVITNTRNVTGYANYFITPIAGSCSGAAFPLVLKVSPVADIAIQSVTACSGSGFSFNPVGVPQNTLYKWGTPAYTNNLVTIKSGNSNLYTNGDSSIISNIVYPGSDTGATVSFTITPVTAGCVGNTFQLNALIKPLPVVANGSVNVCSGSSFTFSPVSNLNNTVTSYSWSISGITPDSLSISGSTLNTVPVANIYQTLTNGSGKVQQVFYNVTPQAAGCTGSNFSFIANVNPTPNFTNKDTVICSGYPFVLNPSPLPFITSYTWEAPVFNIPNSVNGGSAQNVPLSTISQVLINTTNTLDVMATYKVTPSFNSCTGAPFKLTITVKASPYITDTLRSVVCSGSPFSVKMPSNLPAATSYTWDDPVYSNGISGGNAVTTLQKSISQVLKNNNGDTTSGYAVYNVTPNANGCSGISFPLKVTVKTSSAILTSPTLLNPLCSETDLLYTPASNFPGTAFNWVRDSVPGISNAPKEGFADINEKLANSTGSPVTVLYKYTLQFNGCANLKTQVVAVTIKPKPKLVSDINPVSICTGNTFNYIPVSNTLNTSFNWTRSYVVGVTEAVTTGSNSISETLHNTTLNIVQVPYVFSMTAAGCASQETVYEVVNPVLQLRDQLTTLCSGSSFQFTPANTVNATFLWNIASQPTGITGATENILDPRTAISGRLSNLSDTTNIAYYKVTPFIPGASTGNCPGVPFNLKLIVNPVPTLSSATGMPDICSGSAFTYTPTSRTPGTLFYWLRDSIKGINEGSNSGAFSINEVLTNNTIYPVKVSYTFKTNYSGCTDSSKKVSFTLNPAPIVPDQKVTICSGRYFALSPDLEPSGTTYTWDNPLIIPNNSLYAYQPAVKPQTLVADSLKNTLVSAATAVYIINPQNPLCALKPFNVYVTVKPVSLIGTQNTVSCNNQSVSFNPTGTPDSTRFKWKFNITNPSFALKGYTNNDTVFANSITQTIMNSGITPLTAGYWVTPETKGCTGMPFQLNVLVNPTPSVKIVADSTVCSNTQDSVKLYFTGSAPWSYSYKDNVANKLVTENGISQSPYTFVQKTLPASPSYVFSILHISDASCAADTNNLTPLLGYLKQSIRTIPRDSILVPFGSLICRGSYQPMYVNRIEKSYQWMQDGKPVANGSSVNFNAYTSGSYTVNVTDSFGCSNTALNPVVMYDLNSFVLKFTTDRAFCTNIPKQFTNLSDTSAVRNMSWKWDFNGEDSASGYSATYTFKKAGTKKIVLYGNISSCATSVVKDSLMVIYTPVPGIALPMVTTNSGRSVQLKARIFEGVNYLYNWQPFSGLNMNTVYDPVFSYFRSQDFYIKMTSPEGCITTDTLKVRVFDSAIISFVVPKSFSPNGDGSNDILYAYPAGISKMNYFRIYNKYGKMVFETRDPAIGWDGTAFGMKQEMDVYSWIAEGLDYTGKPIQQTGNLLLVR